MKLDRRPSLAGYTERNGVIANFSNSKPFAYLFENLYPQSRTRSPSAHTHHTTKQRNTPHPLSPPSTHLLPSRPATRPSTPTFRRQPSTTTTAGDNTNYPNWVLSTRSTHVHAPSYASPQTQPLKMLSDREEGGTLDAIASYRADAARLLPTSPFRVLDSTTNLPTPPHPISTTLAFNIPSHSQIPSRAAIFATSPNPLPNSRR